jgi:hypothetical protein
MGSDGVSQQGSRLSLGDVALDGIEYSRFRSAPTMILEAQRSITVIKNLLKLFCSIDIVPLKIPGI